MQILPQIESSHVISSLDTYQYTVQVAGMKVVNLAIQPVSLPSAISIVIKQNGSTMATSNTPSANQQVISLSTTLNCAPSDVIQVVVSSSQASDENLNAFQGILDIHPGSSN